MKHRHLWLLALLSILTMYATAVLAADIQATGSVELGVAVKDTSDNPARVNEYAQTRSEEGLSLAPKLNLETFGENSSFDLGVDINGPRDQKIDLEADANRMIRLKLEHQVLEHWKDHETLDQLGATMAGDTAGEQPRVTTDATTGVLAGATGTANIDAAHERYEQELANDYIITRRESKAAADLQLPGLPNIVFHAGVRIDSREGMEQARTLSKCNQCHIQANPKDIDEETRDLTFGITGKFGLVTLDYEFLIRDFTDKSNDPTYGYVGSSSTHAGVADAAVLNYLAGPETYSSTPDSQKDSHSIKARVDFTRDTSLTAAYTKADVESDAVEDDSYTIDNSTLTSEFESFFLKGATRIGAFRLSARGGSYEIEGPEYTVTFPKVVGANLDPALGYDLTTGEKDYQSAESRKVTQFGLDGVYRITTGTTLRLGYEYEETDRAELDLSDTETNTFKVALKSRLNRKLSGRVSYSYQNIDEPFTGADVGIGQVSGSTSDLYPGLAWFTTSTFLGAPGNDVDTNGDGNYDGVYYWNSVYPNRELESSVSPEDVHELKFSSTWAPSSQFAATLFARVRMEENDNVNYQQDTYVPGVTFYYAPNSKMNLTMAYTFNKQKTENQMCVGWYHG